MFLFLASNPTSRLDRTPSPCHYSLLKCRISTHAYTGLKMLLPESTEIKGLTWDCIFQAHQLASRCEWLPWQRKVALGLLSCRWDSYYPEENYEESQQTPACSDRGPLGTRSPDTLTPLTPVNSWPLESVPWPSSSPSSSNQGTLSREAGPDQQSHFKARAIVLGGQGLFR